MCQVPSPVTMQGEFGSFEAFAESVTRMLRSRLRKRGAGDADVDDIVQETLLRSWLRRETFDPARGSQLAWAWSIARTERARFFRRERKHREKRENKESCDDRNEYAVSIRVDSPCEVEDIRDTVRDIPMTSKQRETLRLYLEGQSAGDISASTGAPLNTIRSRIHRAKRLLRQRIVKGP